MTILFIILLIVLWIYFGFIAAVAFSRSEHRHGRPIESHDIGFLFFLLICGFISAFVALLNGAYKWQNGSRGKIFNSFKNWIEKTKL